MPSSQKRYNFLLWLGLVLAVLSRGAAVIPLYPNQNLAWANCLSHLHHPDSGQEQKEASCCLITEDLTNEFTRYRYARESVFSSFTFRYISFPGFSAQAVLNYFSWIKTVSLFILHQLFRL